MSIKFFLLRENDIYEYVKFRIKFRKKGKKNRKRIYSSKMKNRMSMIL